MTIRTVEIFKDFNDIEEIKNINKSSFPDEERIEIMDLVKIARLNRMDFMAVYDGEKVIGFYAVVLSDSLAYLLFLAVDSNQRSKGYGSKILELIQMTYKSRSIILDLESIDAISDNIKQRKSRRRFYLRNGFYPTHFNIDLNDLEMEVLSTSQFKFEEFSSLLDGIIGMDANIKLLKILE